MADDHRSAAAGLDRATRWPRRRPTSSPATPPRSDRAPGPKPTLMVSWAGPTPRRHQHGRQHPARPDRRCTFEGDRRARRECRSCAPFGAAGSSPMKRPISGSARRSATNTARDAWITEGGADLLAIRTVAGDRPRLMTPRAELQTRGRRLRVADRRPRRRHAPSERDEHRAYYACGAVFGLVAEAASRPAVHRLRPGADRRQSRRPAC